MKVCIAEKPSVAREIASILGATQNKDGYIEGNGYQVSWTYGHLCTLKEPHDYSQEWKQWNLRYLPMIPQRFGIKLIDNPTYIKQFKTLERLIQNADEVINCGDAGQEGELIQRWVMNKASCKCPVKRLWISSLTEEAIREGFGNLKDQSNYQKLYEAGLSRAIGDWILGMNATRLYTLRYGQNKQVLSIGRVQTPTLALIVKRQKEIENFVPKQYWTLTTIYRNTEFAAIVRKTDEEIAQEESDRKEKAAVNKNQNTANEKSNEKKSTDDKRGIPQITDLDKGQELLDKVKQSPFTITEITKKSGKETPPRLFDLTSLQVECNKKFSFSADDTLKLIQSLYEKKVTTYPRVDTTFLSEDIYPKVPQTLKGLTDYATLTAPLLSAPIPKSKKVFDNSKVTDHHAIIPTGVPARNLSENERKVYDLVARRFIAAFYPDCKFSTTTVIGEAAKIEFKVTGKVIVEPGWRAVFTKEQTTDEDKPKDDEERLLPEFKKGENGEHTPSLNEKWTTPPKPYTEATLLRAMETAGKLVDDEELRDAMKENGIGRPSTRAAIIETLFKRNYIRKERKSLSATSTGVELINTIQEELLKSAELTGQWEKKLRQIENGTYEAAQFIGELKEMVGKIVYNVCHDTNYRQITIDEAAVKRASEQTQSKTSTGKSEKKKASPKPKPIICPKCKKGTILRGNTAYGCSEYKNGCDFRMPYEQYGKDLSDTELRKVIKNINT